MWGQKREPSIKHVLHQIFKKFGLNSNVPDTCPCSSGLLNVREDPETMVFAVQVTLVMPELSSPNSNRVCAIAIFLQIRHTLSISSYLA